MEVALDSLQLKVGAYNCYRCCLGHHWTSIKCVYTLDCLHQAFLHKQNHCAEGSLKVPDRYHTIVLRGLTDKYILARSSSFYTIYDKYKNIS